MRIRAYMLLRTAFHTIREYGLVVFVKQFFRWMNGERGFFRQLSYHNNLVGDIPADPRIAYEQYQAKTTLSPEQLGHQTKSLSLSADIPQFDILTIVTSDVDLQESFMSLERQSYPNWVWHIIVSPDVLNHPQVQAHPKITCVQKDNRLFEHFAGDYVAILDASDRLAPHALYTVHRVFSDKPETDFVYSDCDEVDENGQRYAPFFKPDYSPEMLLSVNFLFPFGVCRANVWKALQPFTDKWDFALRLSEYTHKIEHIPQVLYHKQHQGTSEEQADVNFVREHLKRLDLQNPLVEIDAHGSFSIKWDSNQERLVSIIIPSRDLAPMLEKCLASIFTLTTYKNCEVIVIDTGSAEPQTYALYDRYRQNPCFRLVEYTGEFNFGRACNFGASHARGDLLLFLNNDTEVLTPNWLSLLAQWFELSSTGVVGAKLLYPDEKIQHAGVIVGMSGLADNLFRLLREHTQTIYGRDDWYRNFLAVTGACLMTSRTVFEAVSGFDEELLLVFSDVEFCIKVHESGYRVIYTPHVRLIHHEATTHRKKLPLMDFKVGTQRLKFWLEQGDPFFNPNLSYSSIVPTVRRNENDTALKRNIEVMQAYYVQ